VRKLKRTCRHFHPEDPKRMDGRTDDHRRRRPLTVRSANSVAEAELVDEQAAQGAPRRTVDVDGAHECSGLPDKEPV
jgi:hypothetical protein